MEQVPDARTLDEAYKGGKQKKELYRVDGRKEKNLLRSHCVIAAQKTSDDDLKKKNFDGQQVNIAWRYVHLLPS